MNETQDLELLIKSRIPLVLIESKEERRVLELATRIAHKLHKPARKWIITEGLTRLGLADDKPIALEKPLDVLHYIKTHEGNAVYILVDFHHHLKDPVAIRLLKDIALEYERLQCTIVLLSHQIDLPPELRHLSAHCHLPLPSAEELRQIVYDVAGEWGATHGQKAVESNNKTLDRLVQNLAGLSWSEARRLARNAIYDDGAITASDIQSVARAKYELVGQDGVVSFEYDTARFSEVGGLSRLKKWLEQRKDGIHPQANRAVQLDPPKGVLLLGVQGCGKSLAAKSVAGVFGVPLLRLDFGTLYNKYYGETERNLRQALRTAELMAPCVIWMDELEKGLNTGGDDGGPGRRVLGTLLTWMAEKKAPVFLVATANDIQYLPPEILRKGRFDEIFFVDLPRREVRREIWRIHLSKRGLKPERFDLDRLSQASEGFSGAEIEQSVVSALYRVQAEGAEFTTDHLLEELEATRPLSVLMAEKIEALRSWAAERTVPAD